MPRIAKAMQKIRPQVFRRYRPNLTLSWVIGDPEDSSQVVSLNQARGAIEGDVTPYDSEKYQHNKDIQPSLIFREFSDIDDPQMRLAFGEEKRPTPK